MSTESQFTALHLSITARFDSLKEDFTHRTRFAPNLLVLFQSLCICEQTFAVLKMNKSIHRPSLSDDHLSTVLHSSTSDNEPNFNALVQAWSRLVFSQ